MVLGVDLRIYIGSSHVIDPEPHLSSHSPASIYYIIAVIAVIAVITVIYYIIAAIATTFLLPSYYLLACSLYKYISNRYYYTQPVCATRKMLRLLLLGKRRF